MTLGRPRRRAADTAAGPVGMAQWAWITSAPRSLADGHGGPELGLQVVSHDSHAGHFAHEIDPGLGHPAVGQVNGQLHRKPDDLHAVEALAGRHRGVARRHYGHPVPTTRQMAVDVVDVCRLGIGRVLRVPVGWADDAQGNLGPVVRGQGAPGGLDLHCAYRHFAETSHSRPRGAKPKGDGTQRSTFVPLRASPGPHLTASAGSKADLESADTLQHHVAVPRRDSWPDPGTSQ